MCTRCIRHTRPDASWLSEYGGRGDPERGKVEGALRNIQGDTYCVLVSVADELDVLTGNGARKDLCKLRRERMEGYIANIA
jgi:hypothetical protein